MPAFPPPGVHDPSPYRQRDLADEIRLRTLTQGIISDYLGGPSLIPRVLEPGEPSVVPVRPRRVRKGKACKTGCGWLWRWRRGMAKTQALSRSIQRRFSKAPGQTSARFAWGDLRGGRSLRTGD